ncbi:MAG: hypothetical protein ACFE7R_11435 [Candidatus Hodarchaeota archaeon]
MDKSKRWVISRRPINPSNSIFRLASLLLSLYITWMYLVSLSMFGNWNSGVWWRNGPAGSLFPIPMYPGILDVLVAANALDSFLYLVVFQMPVWLVFVILTLLHAFSPYGIYRHTSIESI